MRSLASLVSLIVLCLPSLAFAQESSCGAAYEAGQEARAAGDLPRAREQFQICADQACPEFIVADCSSWLGEVETLIPSVVFKVLDQSGLDVEGATVLVDGVPIDSGKIGSPLELSAGDRVVEVTHPEFERYTTRFKLAAGEQRRVISLRLVPLPQEQSRASEPLPKKSHALPVGFYPAAGLSVVGFGVFAGLGLAGLAKESKLEDDPCAASGTCDTSGLKTTYLVADIGLGVGVVSAVVATYLVLSRRQDGPQKSMEVGVAQLSLGPTRGGATAGLVGRF